MNKIIGLVTASKNVEKDYEVQKPLNNFLSKKFGKFYILDLNYFKIFDKTPKKKFVLPKGIKYIYPQSISELNYFLKGKQFIAFNGIKKSLNFYIILFLLNFFRVKLILLQNLGDIPARNIGQSYSFKDSRRKFYVRSNYIFFRFFTLIGIFPRIKLYLSSDKKFINYIKKNFISYKIKKILPFVDISYFQKVSLVPDREIENTNIKKYLTFVDTGFYHPDRIRREDIITSQDEKYYFNKINLFLNLIKKKLKKKIIICLHPNSDLKFYKSKFKKFKVTKFNTTFYIARSKLCIFHASSLIYDAKRMGKNIIILTTKSLGKFWYYRIKLILSRQKFLNLNLDIPTNILKNNIDQKLKKLKKLKKTKKSNTNLLIYNEILKI